MKFSEVTTGLVLSYNDPSFESYNLIFVLDKIPHFVFVDWFEFERTEFVFNKHYKISTIDWNKKQNLFSAATPANLETRKLFVRKLFNAEKVKTE